MNLHAGNFAGDRVHDICRPCSEEFLALHRGRRVTKRLLLAGDAQGGDNHLVEEFIVLFKDDLQHCAVTDFDRGIFVAY